MGGGAPLDHSHVGQVGSEAPAGKGAVLSTEGAEGALGPGAAAGAEGPWREGGTARLGACDAPTIETKMRTVEVPLTLLMAPDTPTTKESSP